MKNKGFILMDVIVGLFFIGLITSLSFPLIASSYSNYGKIIASTEMNYLGESIYERLSSKDDYAMDIIQDLTLGDETIFDDFDDHYSEKYEAVIIKRDYCENFLDISIIIKSNSHGGNISDVEFKGAILR